MIKSQLVALLKSNFWKSYLSSNFLGITLGNSLSFKSDFQKLIFIQKCFQDKESIFNFKTFPKEVLTASKEIVNELS